MIPADGWTWDQIIGLAALIIGGAGLFYAGRQFYHGRRATAAASLISIQESFRQAWARFQDTPEAEQERRYSAFSEVMNLIEIGCALHQDKIFVGSARRIFEEYLCHLLAMINDSPNSKTAIEQMQHAHTTFEHILAFIASHGDQVRIKIDPPKI